ncbi:TonB-dependent siderophore receptor [Roseomonas sp. GC11]|uniref:TonB-dependent siderophore receptor n=1 Tax=Roseomonas sp. GC11 TaxID=2950546 RepID=UPI00210E2FB7|nr:TonB-dependent siderophore receptor [Roseomonas sp. GC11]MCQ4159100.1 TonB-dependent siderophore receptor [Roseomonas sp. GC11]
MPHPRIGRLAWLLASTALALLAPAPASPGARAQQPPATAAAEALDFAIAPQPLASALALFGRQAGWQFSAEASLLEGRASPGVTGRMSRAAALHRLLAGTGLAARGGESGVVMLQPLPAPPASSAETTLPEVSVAAATPRATDPVQGYLATLGASAMRGDTPLVETPQSLSVVPRDQMRDTASSSLSDALAYTPGVTSQSSTFSRAVDDFMIRGFNVADAYSGMMRDGLRLAPNVYAMAQEPYGLERIEVVRGAASVLYGQLAPGGLVNSLSKRPTEAPFSEVNLSAGSQGRAQVSGDTSGRLNEDGTLLYRLTGLWRDGQNWVDHVRDDRVYIAPAITWKPDAETALTLLASYQRTSTQFAPPMPYAVLSAGTMPRDRFIGEPGFDKFEVEAYSLGYTLERRLSDAVTWRSSARGFSSTGAWDYLTYGSLAANGRLSRGVSVRDEQSSSITLDNSLETRFATGPVQHTLLAGIDYFHALYSSHRYQGSATSLSIYDPVYGSTPVVNRSVDRGSRTTGEQYGAYLQDQARIDRLVLSLGLRYDEANRLTHVYRSGSDVKQNDSAVTSRAGAVYLFDSGFAPYVSFSQSFAQVIAVDANGNPLDPSHSTQYEAGLRYQPPGTELLFSSAVYELTQTNALTTDAAGNSLQYGKVRSRGLELEARGQFGPLGLVASYAYTDARIRKSALPEEVGQRVGLMPLNTAALWATYRMDRLGAQGLTLGGGLRYFGEDNIPGYSGDVPAYTLVNAMARYELGDLLPQLPGAALSLNVANLTGEKYFTCSGTSTGCRYGAPRSWLATLSYRW